MQTTWLIGQEWKCSNVWSGLILIGRGLDLIRIEENLDVFSMSEQLLFSFEGADTFSNEQCVSMAARVHLFPSRTQQLSSFAVTILGWRRPGKITRCAHQYSSIAQSVEHAAVNRRVVGSSPTWGARLSPDANCVWTLFILEKLGARFYTCSFLYPLFFECQQTSLFAGFFIFLQFAFQVNMWLNAFLFRFLFYQ